MTTKLTSGVERPVVGRTWVRADVSLALGVALSERVDVGGRAPPCREILYIVAFQVVAHHLVCRLVVRRIQRLCALAAGNIELADLSACLAQPHEGEHHRWRGVHDGLSRALERYLRQLDEIVRKHEHDAILIVVSNEILARELAHEQVHVDHRDRHGQLRREEVSPGEEDEPALLHDARGRAAEEEQHRHNRLDRVETLAVVVAHCALALDRDELVEA